MNATKIVVNGRESGLSASGILLRLAAAAALALAAWWLFRAL
jgi:hypothetical protein